MAELEKRLVEAKDARIKMIATDGVFSMDGFIAKLDDITSLAEKYDAMVMVDDSHATGFVGKTGRGSAEYNNVMNKIDVWTSTLGKSIGWCFWRIYHRTTGNYRHAPSAIPSLSFLQYIGAGYCCSRN